MTKNYRFKLLIAATFLMQFGGAAGTIGVPILAKKLFDTSFWGLAMIGVTGSLVYSIVCFVIGAFADRVNPYRMMMLGAFCFALAFSFAIVADAAWHLILIYIVGGAAMAFFWPMLEAALVQGAKSEQKNKKIGLFNISWSLADALGAATAGGLYLLWPRLPFVLLIVCLAGVFVISLIAGRIAKATPEDFAPAHEEKPREGAVSAEVRQGFAKAAWTGNFVAHGFTGILRSVFAAPAVDVFKMSALGIGLAIGTFNAVRTLTFAVLRRRNDWAYREGLFAGAHRLLAVGMVIILFAAWVSPHLLAIPLVYLAVSFAGVGCGLIYYSSIYYSINLSRQVASHTRLHEAYLGAGATGLVLGAGGLHLFFTLPAMQGLMLRVGADPVLLGNLSPFILSAFAVSGALALSRRFFLPKLRRGNADR